MAIEKLKIICKAQKLNLDQSTNLKPQKEPQTWTDQATDMAQMSIMHIFKLLTPSVEKTVNCY